MQSGALRLRENLPGAVSAGMTVCKKDDDLPPMPRQHGLQR
jgi:hypothetical protein